MEARYRYLQILHSRNDAVSGICTLFTMGTLLLVVSAHYCLSEHCCKWYLQIIHDGNNAASSICTLFTLGSQLSVVFAHYSRWEYSCQWICTFFLLYNTIHEVCHALIKLVNQIKRLANLLIHSPVESIHLFQSFGQILTYPIHQCFIYLHPPNLSSRLSDLSLCTINK